MTEICSIRAQRYLEDVYKQLDDALTERDEARLELCIKLSTVSSIRPFKSAQRAAIAHGWDYLFDGESNENER